MNAHQGSFSRRSKQSPARESTHCISHLYEAQKQQKEPMLSEMRAMGSLEEGVSDWEGLEACFCFLIWMLGVRMVFSF